MATIWKNGELIPAIGAVDANDRGILLGDGVFETMAVVDGEPLRLARHFERLKGAVETLGMPLVLDLIEIETAISGVCGANGIQQGSTRVTILRGPGPRGVMPPETPHPTVLIGATSGTVGNADTVRMVVASSTRRNEFSPLSRIKSTNYGDLILARQEAAARGADDALILNTQRNVAEATSANVFLLIDDEWVTPPPADGALPGIMRGLIIEHGFAKEHTITSDALSKATGAFLSTSLSIRPVSHLDGRVLPNSDVTASLRALVFQDD